MTASRIKERIVEANSLGDNEIERILERGSALTKKELVEHLRRYIGYRFLLDRKEISKGTLKELAAASVESILKESGGNLQLAGVTGSCSGMGSPDQKRILMLVVLQKKLGVSIDPRKSAEIETVEELAEEIYRLITDSMHDCTSTTDAKENAAKH